MIEGKNVSVKVDSDFFWPIVVAFFLFWQQSGWYRVDCALGVGKACDLIAAEKEYSGVSK